MVTIADLRASNWRVRVHGQPARVLDYLSDGSGASDLPTTLRVLYDDGDLRAEIPNDAAVAVEPPDA
jgi:hypothetical protein